MNRLFVAYKPPFVSSNRFLGQLKRKYGVKKAGFSGTLDPFAKGVLIIAFGSHTRLFRFLKKAPKTYRATLWLGAPSQTLDIEGVKEVHECRPLEQNKLLKELKALEGELTYLPPKYSAKKIGGKRAYELARAGEDVSLKTITSSIYEIKLLRYNHPFVSFEATVSEGTYIRSLGEILCERLGVEGSLSSLERVKEGEFIYNDEKSIKNIANFLNLDYNYYQNNLIDMELGKKLRVEHFKHQEDGDYLVQIKENLYSIITIDERTVTYKLNKVELC